MSISSYYFKLEDDSIWSFNHKEADAVSFEKAEKNEELDWASIPIKRV